VGQELLTLPEHLRSPPVFSGVRVTRSLVVYVCFADRCLSFCTFPFGHCVGCSSSIYGFWLHLWYLQTLLIKLCNKCKYLLCHHSCYYSCCSYLLHQWLLLTYIDLEYQMKQTFFERNMIDWFFEFNATFSNISAISWRPVLVVEESGVPGENHRPWASNW
jgi:hypothetical protein